MRLDALKAEFRRFSRPSGTYTDFISKRRFAGVQSRRTALRVCHLDTVRQDIVTHVRSAHTSAHTPHSGPSAVAADITDRHANVIPTSGAYLGPSLTSMVPIASHAATARLRDSPGCSCVAALDVPHLGHLISQRHFPSAHFSSTVARVPHTGHIWLLISHHLIWLFRFGFPQGRHYQNARSVNINPSGSR